MMNTMNAKLAYFDELDRRAAKMAKEISDGEPVVRETIAACAANLLASDIGDYVQAEDEETFYNILISDLNDLSV